MHTIMELLDMKNRNPGELHVIFIPDILDP